MNKAFKHAAWVNDPVLNGLRDNQLSQCNCTYLDALSCYLKDTRVFVAPEYTDLNNCRRIVSAWNDNKRKCDAFAGTDWEGKWAHPRLREGPKGDGAPDFDDVDFLETYVVCGRKDVGGSYIGMVYDADTKCCMACRMPESAFGDLDDFCMKFIDGQWDYGVDTIMGLEITNFWGLVSY